uniref:Uncharacterized protein n=1 Tax=Neogobius melanostomus TaxID=47308 RepID=A0A8C6V021_9GOBI
MMKTSRGVIVTCLIYSDKSLPMHSLTLLHWFANNVDIDNNNVVRLSFNTNGDFGSHYYSNYEGLLPSPARGYQFYTVGNVNRPPGDMCPIHEDLPAYVLYPQVREFSGTGRNRDRIVVSVQAQSSSAHTVSQAYLTQHFRRQDNRGPGYDPDHTFRISTNLLQQLRQDQFDQNIHNNRLIINNLTVCEIL